MSINENLDQSQMNCSIKTGEETVAKDIFDSLKETTVNIKVELDNKKSNDNSDDIENAVKTGVEISEKEHGDSPKKQMPTKAQQKLFESTTTTTAAIEPTKELKVKPCKVRIKRDNLLQLEEKFASEGANKLKNSKKSYSKPGNTKKTNVMPKISSPMPTSTKKQASPKAKTSSKVNSPKENSPKETSPKVAVKRKADSGESPPVKKSRTPKDPKKNNTGFFIKLSSSPTPTKKKAIADTPTKSQSPKSQSPKSQPAKSQLPKSQSPKSQPAKSQLPKSQTPKSQQPKSHSPKSQSPKFQSSKSLISAREKTPRKVNVRASISSPTICTTKATKFSRSQLIKSFGKRYFNSIVKIKRCQHPLMITFEFNARAQKVQSTNKTKKLSVSFKEQVEIIGCSDTESNDGDENSTKIDHQLSVATPALLKKIENGNVVDEIEFDPKLFTDGDFSSNSSTPLRKKVEKKSYSPLKDDSSSSARSELLKLANEKLPPCGLSRLRDATVEEEEDEDDECEYIVPIELPQRRISRNDSLNNTIDSAASTKGSVDDTSETNNVTESDKVQKVPVIKVEISSGNTKNEEENTEKPEIALLTTEDTSTNNTKNEGENIEKPEIEETQIVEDKEDNIENLKNDEIQKAPETSEPLKEMNVDKVNGNNTQTDTMGVDSPKDNKDSNSGNESMKLFLDDDSCVNTPCMSVTSDSQDGKLVKAALEKLTEDIEMPGIECPQENELLAPTKSIIADTKNAVST